MSFNLFIHSVDTGGKLYDGSTSSELNRLANRAYVQQIVADGGGDYLQSVLSRESAIPGSLTAGDRYLADATTGAWTLNNVYEWDGAAWIESTPTAGTHVYVEDTGQSLIFDSTDATPANRWKTLLTQIGGFKIANNLSELPDAAAKAAARSNLGIDDAFAVESSVALSDARLSGVLPATKGGTGLNTIAAGHVLYADANDSIASAAPGATSGVQPHHAILDDLSGLTQAANKGVMFSGANAADTFDLTAFARTLLDDADAPSMRTTLGLGSISTQAANSVAITGGNISGVALDLSGSGSITLADDAIPAAKVTGLDGDFLVDTNGVLDVDADGSTIGDVSGGKLGILDAGVSLAKMANLAGASVIGNAGGSAATPVALAIDSDLSTVSGSDDTLASAKAIKAYVDSQVTAQDLDIAGDSGTGAVDLDSQSLTIQGTAAQGISASAANQAITLTIADATASQKGVVLASPTVHTAMANALDSDLSAVSGSDDTLASAKAIKSYVDSQVTAQDLDFAGDSGTGAIDLDSQSLTIAGGNGLSSSASNQTATLEIDTAVTVDISTAQTLSNKGLSSPSITGGTISTAQINSTPIGEQSRSTGKFTSIDVQSDATFQADAMPASTFDNNDPNDGPDLGGTAGTTTSSQVQILTASWYTDAAFSQPAVAGFEGWSDPKYYSDNTFTTEITSGTSSHVDLVISDFYWTNASYFNSTQSPIGRVKDDNPFPAVEIDVDGATTWTVHGAGQGATARVTLKNPITISGANLGSLKPVVLGDTTPYVTLKLSDPNEDQYLTGTPTYFGTPMAEVDSVTDAGSGNFNVTFKSNLDLATFSLNNWSNLIPTFAYTTGSTEIRYWRDALVRRAMRLKTLGGAGAPSLLEAGDSALFVQQDGATVDELHYKDVLGNAVQLTRGGHVRATHIEMDAIEVVAANGSVSALPGTVAAMKNAYAFDVSALAGGSALTLPVPAAADIGRTVRIMVAGGMSSANALTVTAGTYSVTENGGSATGTMDDQSSIALSQPYQSLCLLAVAASDDADADGSSKMCWKLI